MCVRKSQRQSCVCTSASACARWAQQRSWGWRQGADYRRAPSGAFCRANARAQSACGPGPTRRALSRARSDQPLCTLPPSAYLKHKIVLALRLVNVEQTDEIWVPQSHPHRRLAKRHGLDALADGSRTRRVRRDGQRVAGVGVATGRRGANNKVPYQARRRAPAFAPASLRRAGWYSRPRPRTRRHTPPPPAAVPAGSAPPAARWAPLAALRLPQTGGRGPVDCPKGKATLCPGQSLSFISRQKKIEPHELKFVPPPLRPPLSASRWASRIVACGRRLRAPPAEHGSVPREEPCRGPARPAAAAQTRPRRRGRSGDGVGEEAAARGSCGGGVARAVSERARRGGGDEICVRGRRAWPLAAAAG